MKAFAPLLLPLFLLTSTALAGDPDAPATLADLRRSEAADVAKEFVGLPVMPPCDASRAITFTLRHGKLHVDTSISAAGVGYRQVKLNGLPGIARVQVIARSTVGTADSPQNIRFVYRDLTQPGALLVGTEVYSGTDLVQVSQDADLNDGSSTSVQYVQASADGPQSVSLYLQFPAENPGDAVKPRHLTGWSLSQLCRDYPEEINRHLRPIFRMLHQEPAAFEVEPAVAWQILGSHWTPDRATAAAADDAVARLGADSYQQREDAMRDLHALGQPAAVYLMNRAESRLTPEQSMRLDLFLSVYRPLSEDQAERLASDPEFLLDCLYCSDATLRQLAVDQLAQTMGKPVGLDVNANSASLRAAVLSLRESLEAAATRP
jgi:hypothetical protein